MYIDNVEFSACRTTHTPQHSNTAQQHSTAQPFTRVCLEFSPLWHSEHCTAITLCQYHFRPSSKKKSDLTDFVLKWAVRTFTHLLLTTCNLLVFLPLFSYPCFQCFIIFFVSPGHHGTIQNLIPGWTTIVKLLKQLKNWQSPSRDPWSNCLINSREDDKGQSYYYSGWQKDNSKTICGRAG